MNPTDIELSPADKQMEEIARRGLAALDRLSPAEHPERTPECPPLLRFHDALSIGWTTTDDAHRGGCGYCQKTWAMTQRVATEPALTFPEPVSHSTSIVFRMSPPALAASSATLTAVASPSCAGGASADQPLPDEVWINTDDGLKLRLARHMRTGWMTLQLVGRTVTESATVWVADRQIELVERFSPDGFAVVKAEDVIPVWRDAAALEIKFL